MGRAEQGQVVAGAAEVYDARLVPALFADWAPRLADAARLAPGERVLDVACGSGVVARHAATIVGANGSVTGLDLNEPMLAVARRRAPQLDWRHGRAEALPFEDASFDAVLCGFGLMFFDDKAAALREMRRVLRPGGRLALTVWDSLERIVPFATLAGLLERLFGTAVGHALRAPFALGDPATLRALLDAGGLGAARVETSAATARFASMRDWMEAEMHGWTPAGAFDEAQFERLVAAAEAALAPCVGADGSVAFAMPAHLVVARVAG